MPGTFHRHFEKVTAKRRDFSQLRFAVPRRSEVGKRFGACVKNKLHLEQEFVIGGYTEPEGARKYFDALLVGFYEGRGSNLLARVGTGFSDELLRSLFAD
jgi:ATP-dependent DNA ligase